MDARAVLVLSVVQFIEMFVGYFSCKVGSFVKILFINLLCTGCVTMVSTV